MPEAIIFSSQIALYISRDNSAFAKIIFSNE
jgi:hypothetical protein